MNAEIAMGDDTPPLAEMYARTSAKARGLTPEQILQQILAAPETKDIADSFGLDVKLYASRVLHYVQNPKAEPELFFLQPQDAKALGLPATVAEAAKIIEEGAAKAEDAEARAERGAFVAGDADRAKQSVAAAGLSTQVRAPQAAPAKPLGSALKGQVKRGLSAAPKKAPDPAAAAPSSAPAAQAPDPPTGGDPQL
jgi:hypothetical protein